MRTIHIAQADNMFSNTFVPEVYNIPDGWLIESTSRCTVQYMIETEWRSWGLKDLTVTPTGTAQFEIEVLNEAQADTASAETRTITFEPNRIKVDAEPGNSVIMGGAEIWLDADFNVDYERSRLQLYTLRRPEY